MVVSIEDAGFEIRDMISWISNKTFPKSLNIGKAIDKAAGAKREVISTYSAAKQKGSDTWSGKDRTGGKGSGFRETATITEPSTPEAKQWDGWGTGLKPTVEPIVMARKPVEGTVANNVLTYGTGGLNIDASRIGTETITTTRGKGFAGSFEGGINNNGGNTHEGRWPANVILDEQAAELVDEQSGTSKSPKTYVRGVGTLEGERVAYANIGEVAGTESKNYGDSGGASRFFYVAKASKRDRNEGLEDLEESVVGSYAGNVANKGNKIGANPDKPNQPAKNFHPTVKPTQLMRYLVKLITPPGGTVLDPFTGSGSTGKAAILEGFDFIGIELTEDYWPIIEGRLKHAEAKVAERIKETSDQEQEKLF
jgi:site-specific DNA-methyltransferase (adenine-specific)